MVLKSMESGKKDVSRVNATRRNKINSLKLFTKMVKSMVQLCLVIKMGIFILANTHMGA
jgi:hypothetical protein